MYAMNFDGPVLSAIVGFFQYLRSTEFALAAFISAALVIGACKFAEIRKAGGR